MRSSCLTSLRISARAAPRAQGAARRYHVTPLRRSTSSSDDLASGSSTKPVKTTSGEEPKIETNTVRTLDRLASALRARQAGHEAVNKLSRLRGGGEACLPTHIPRVEDNVSSHVLLLKISFPRRRLLGRQAPRQITRTCQLLDCEPDDARSAQTARVSEDGRFVHRSRPSIRKRA